MHQRGRDPDSSKPSTAIGSPSTILQANEVLSKVGPLRKNAGGLRLDAILRSIFALCPDAITITDLNGNIVECNSAALEMGGYPSKDEVIGKNVLLFTPEKDRERAIENLKRLLEQTTLKNIEWTLLTGDGREFLAEISASVVPDASGKPMHFALIAKDISERKRLEQKLAASNKRLEYLVSSSPAVIYTCDPQVDAFGGPTTFTSRNAISLLGYEPRELLEDSRFWANRVHPDDAPHAFADLPRVLKEGHYAAEYRFLHKDGTYRWIHDELNLVRDEAGKPVEFVGSMMDITERKRMEVETARTKSYLESSLANIPNGVLLLDEQARFSYVNPAFLKWVGREARDFIGKTLPEVSPPILSPETTKIIAERVEKRVKTGEPITGAKVEIIGKDGKPMPLSYSAAGIRDEQGNVVGEVVFLEDITERRRMEDELRQRSEDIKALNEGITQRLLQKVDQIDNMSTVRERLRKSPDVSTGLSLILDTAMGDLGMDVGAVLVIDRELNAVKVRSFKSKIEGVDVDESYPLDGRFLELEASKENRRISKIVGEGELSILRTVSIHCAPILFGKEAHGILVFGSRKNTLLDNSDLAVLALYSELASALFEMQKVTVTPLKERTRTAERLFELETGSSYLVKNDVEKAFEVFVDNVFSGLEGLCITRQFPSKVRRKYGLEKTPIIWLTSERAEGETTVHSIQDLSILIANFLEKTKRGVVLLDGFEYLMTNHGFEILIRFLQTSRSRFEQKDAILIAPLLEKALDAREVALIEREMKPLIAE